MTDDPSTPPPPDGDPSLPPTEPIPAVPPPGGTPEALAAEQAASEQARAHWYDQRGAVAAVMILGLAGVLLLVGWLVWWSDDDDDGLAADETISTATIVTGSTLDPAATTTSTIPPASIVQGSTLDNVTLPSTTTTTSSTTTTAPPTTQPESTAPTTTAAPATTTSAPAATTTTSSPGVTVPPSPAATLLDVLAASPDLSRLHQLVNDAGLAAVLDGEEPLTLFAPSNAAFETLEAAPGGSELLADPDQLERLLLRHVAAGSLDSTAVFAAAEIETLNGDTLTIDADQQTVDGAELPVLDVETANGFLHVVDAVLIPPPTG